MMSFSGSRYSRRSSSARRRQARATRIFLLVGSLFALASFFGGYAWQSKKSKLRGAAAVGAADVAADPASRAAALDAIDEAVTANFEGRKEDALSAIQSARNADRFAPGLDIFRAQLALEAGDLEAVRASSLAAQQRRQNVSGASLLLALSAWFGQVAGGVAQSQAIDAADPYFVEGAEANLFDSSLWFFWADLLRSAAREKEGYARAQQALHRLNLWDSYSMLSLKLALASAEDPTGSIDAQIPHALPAAQDAIISLWLAIMGGADPAIPRAELRRFLTVRQAQVLAFDPAMAPPSAAIPAARPLP